MYTVYILRSKTTGKFYTGYTKNISDRLHRHNTKRNPSTKNDGPWVIVYTETYDNRQQAWLRERHIKKLKGGNGFRKLVTERWPSG